MKFISDEIQKKLSEFSKFVKNKLEIKDNPKILILNGKSDIKTSASYNYSSKPQIIKVNAKNRACFDIMRSIAHEMVHHKQFEEGRLEIKPDDIHSEIEYEANALAGVFIKEYAKIDPTIYDC